MKVITKSIPTVGILFGATALTTAVAGGAPIPVKDIVINPGSHSTAVVSRAASRAAAPVHTLSHRRAHHVGMHRSHTLHARSPWGAPTPHVAHPSKPVHSYHPHYSFAPNQSMGRHIRINGFMSAGLAGTNYKVNYAMPGYGKVNNKVNYTTNSAVGLQVSAQMNRQFSAVFQLTANGDNINGHTAFSPAVQLAFVRYQYNRRLQARAGRFQSPMLMFSNTREVGYSYPWINLPNEVYSLVPFNSMNGLDVVYTMPVGSNWSLKVNPFGGAAQSTYDLKNIDNVMFAANLKEDNIMGGAVSIGDQYVTLRALYSRMSFDSAAVNNGSINILPAFTDAKVDFYSAGVKANYHNFIFDGEYAHRKMPKDTLASLTGYYGTLGYRYQKWLPNVTYARIKTTNASKLPSTLPELNVSQVSYTAGLNYYVNNSVVVKGSLSWVQPKDNTNGLFQDKVLQKTVMMYGLSVNAVF